ncbi:GMC family oxidoreductase N-terminal domain-containing protein [Candidatus Amarobacter glycogenicus]|uniref:GMC family oxidoreductase n=1 Tax=Candidatus Amarobacter glycogenicus TaxID=3140699 RepID=UPI0031CC9BA5
MEGEFDVLVVGAGSAGAVIAARASEDPRRSVLLLEAGPDYPDTAGTPFDLVNSHNNSYADHDWGFSYQATAAGRSAPFPRGRVTGGSSAVNTTIALRGMPEDYDAWAAAGNPEWAWERVLPAFKRLERDLDFGDRPYHGDAGPITIQRYRTAELTQVHQAWLEASDALGYPRCEDANDPAGWGSGPHPMNKIGRLRISTAIGYLSAARARPNLCIRANTLTRRVVFEGTRAVGVEVETDGNIEVLRARTIILSAGALQSPAILMRSGIGPRDELERHGIELLRDIQGVGTRLSDHPALAVVCRAKDPSLLDADQPIVQTILRYTAPGSAFRNDLQIEAFSFSPRGGPLTNFAIAAVLEQVHGTGTLRLASADPHAPPVVEQRFCEDERDRSRLVACLRDTIAFVKTKPLSDMVVEQTFPDPRRALSDESLGDLCLRLSASGFHPCATVPMGPASDQGAVVDQYGRCHSVEGLVVADASIMPTVTRANTNLTSIMIGEMVGEWVRTRGAELYGL